jgi:cation-transporting ATPase I
VVTTSLLSAAVLVGVIQTPGLSHFFGCRPLGPLGWGTAAMASLGATSLASAAARLWDREFFAPLRLAAAWEPEPAASGTGARRPRAEGEAVAEAVFVDGLD